MKNSVLKRYTIIGTIILAAVILCLSLICCTPNLPGAPSDTSLQGTDGNPVASVSITELENLNYLTCVNYTPDEYLNPNYEIQGTPVDLRKKNEFAQKGTFVFVIRHIDPMAEDFSEKAAALDPYLQGDHSWHFTLYIPKIWSACNVYVKYVLTDRVGTLSDYDFIKYSDYSGTTEVHSNQTKPIFLDLSFYFGRHTISSDPLYAATVVTIHYEAEENKEAGMDGIPLIGSEAAIRKYTEYDRTLSIVAYILAGLITGIFLFVCLLKKQALFLPHLFIVFGVFGILFCSYLLTTTTLYPYVLETIRSFAIAFTLLCAMTALLNRRTLFKSWCAASIACALFCIAVPLLGLLPFNILAWERIFKICCTLIFSFLILFFVLWNAKREDADLTLLINPLLVCIFGFSLYLPYTNLFALCNPTFWLSLSVLFYTAFLGGRFFILQERKLNYLTGNLQAAVQIQTKELKTLLDERDELFRYVSHDMKKPLVSMEHFLCIAKQREKDEEQKKTLEIINNKINELARDFAELSKFSKNNFVAEESKSFELNELLEKTKEDFEPDCCANGILLKIIPCKISVYGKYDSLRSVISNIVLNAVEHSDCTQITVSASKKKGICLLCVSDNGKGITTSRDIFYPYYSESKDKNNSGLGLYLSKCFMKSMNGDLYYKQENGLLTFIITLPLA